MLEVGVSKERPEEPPIPEFKEEPDLLNFSADSIAREMTRAEWLIFKQIESREILNQAWQSKTKTELSPNVTKLIVWFNHVRSPGAVSDSIRLLLMV